MKGSGPPPGGTSAASGPVVSAPVPVGYGQLLTTLKAEVRAAQLRAHRVVNAELLGLYWTIGKAILDQQTVEG